MSSRGSAWPLGQRTFHELERCPIVLRGAGQVLGLEAADALEVEAERLAMRTASRPSWMENRRTAALRFTRATGSPATEATPLTMPLRTSFDQRSPHRFVVALAEGKASEARAGSQPR
jgi:hypothetical protein